MDTVPFLSEVAILFSLAIVVIFLCYKLRIPSIVGFLLTGVLVGPYGFNLIREIQTVEFFAEIGIIVLVFSIGMQFSFQRLFELRRSVLIGGGLQVFLTVLFVTLLMMFAGMKIAPAFFFGMLLCHSSTTIIFRVYQERGEVVSPQGENTLAISLFQDLASIPMLLVLPLLSGTPQNLTWELLLLTGKVAGVILLAFIIAKYLVGGILRQVTGTRSPELFLMSILVVCLFVTMVSSRIGLSLALGAFLAGLALSESEYIYQAFATVLPLRDLFTAFFFVSIGMLLNTSLFLAHPWTILLFTLAVVMGKTILASLSALLLGLSFRTSLLVGLALSNIGEFAFILAMAGNTYGLFPQETYGLFLAVTILSMAFSPLIIHLSPRIADRLLQYPLLTRVRPGLYSVTRPEDGAQQNVLLRDHLIVVGCGYAGKNVASAAATAGIPYVVIEVNPTTVRSERERGIPIFFGDALQQSVLEHAGIVHARVLIISIPDPDTTTGVIAVARSLNPRLYILARSRFFQDVERLTNAGASEVIPDEYQTAAEFIFRILLRYLIPPKEIERFLTGIRQEQSPLFPTAFYFQGSVGALDIPRFDIRSFRVEEGSLLSGITLREADLRNRYQVSLLVIQRVNGEMILPGGDERLLPGDLVLGVGSSQCLERMAGMFGKRNG